MAGLQRSATSFRRQGSSGLVWDDRFLSGELNQINQKEDNNNREQQQQVKEARPSRNVNTLDRSRSSGGGRAFRTGKVSPAIEPPSPRVSACGLCSAFGKPDKTRQGRPKSGKRRT
uniref:MAPK kinase substrate protein n=1 Tax=Davidia involucrata TaxID=16924 RepID=A0A5B6YHK8_DAVIN